MRSAVAVASPAWTSKTMSLIVIEGLVQMARKQRAEQWAEHRRRRDEEERQCRMRVIAEFDAGDPEVMMHAMADEILKYRRAVRLLAKAIGWADAGAPFALIAPGPRWRPRDTPELPEVAPPAA